MKDFKSLQIIIDSREKRPYKFENYPTLVEPLPVGDYSVVGLEDCIAIERKEINDLVSCLSHDRERFERELFKGKVLDFFGLVAECSLSQIVNGKYKSMMTPKAVLQSLLTFSIRYKLPVFFCESRQYGQLVTESLLIKFVREIEKNGITKV